MEKLRAGVIIEGKKTLPAKVKKISSPAFPPRIPPIRERSNIPTSWLSISITEGRNRQVRKMTASIGHPTLRLIRIRIKNLLIDGLSQGEVRKLSDKEIDNLKNKKP